MTSYIKHLESLAKKTVWDKAKEIQQKREDENHPKQSDLEDIFREAKEVWMQSQSQV